MTVGHQARKSATTPNPGAQALRCTKRQVPLPPRCLVFNPTSVTPYRNPHIDRQYCKGAAMHLFSHRTKPNRRTCPRSLILLAFSIVEVMCSSAGVAAAAPAEREPPAPRGRTAEHNPNLPVFLPGSHQLRRRQWRLVRRWRQLRGRQRRRRCHDRQDRAVVSDALRGSVRGLRGRSRTAAGA
jgi:hypothetical protein